MRLIVLGTPGAGKGTQARNLAKHYNIDHISTGDILRDQMKRGTEIGIQITDLMNRGQLVSDQIAVDLVRERLAEDRVKNGFILDGFPRNLRQAEILDTLPVTIDKVVKVAVEDAIIVERMSGRVTCPKCGAMFHTFYYPPKVEKVCDVCGDTLIQREDDKAKTVIQRLKIYHELTEPIVDFYKNKNILLEVNGVGDVNEITKTILNLLGEKS